MESKQVSKKQAFIISSLLILLFSSRAIYNIITVAVQSSHIHPFGYSNAFATDMVCRFYSFISYHVQVGHSKEGDIVYFCVVLLWEVIPICLIVLFFRIRRPSTLRVSQEYSSFSYSLSQLWKSQTPENCEEHRHFFNHSNISSFRSSLSAGSSLLRSRYMFVKHSFISLLSPSQVMSLFQVFPVKAMLLILPEVMAQQITRVTIVHQQSIVLMEVDHILLCLGPHLLSYSLVVRPYSVKYRHLLHNTLSAPLLQTSVHYWLYAFVSKCYILIKLFGLQK